jgi:hypothetical protein
MAIDKDKLKKFINDALVIANNHAWTEGGSEITRWDVCTGCGQADWLGHKPDCIIQQFVNDAYEILEQLD